MTLDIYVLEEVISMKLFRLFRMVQSSSGLFLSGSLAANFGRPSGSAKHPFISIRKGQAMIINLFHALSGIVTQRAIRFSIGLMALLVQAGSAQAGIVNATFLSTADNRQLSNDYVDNVALGNTFKVVIAMDNGGNSLINQTWTSNNVLSLTFEFNNGAHKTVFAAVFGRSTGDFVTDGSGTLISVPSEWRNTSAASAVISTNSSQTPNAWFLSEGNDKYFTNLYTKSVGIPDPSAITLASNWTLTASGAGGEVPEPTSMAIFGLGALGMAYRARRKSKA